MVRCRGHRCGTAGKETYFLLISQLESNSDAKVLITAPWDKAEAVAEETESPHIRQKMGNLSTTQIENGEFWGYKDLLTGILQRKLEVIPYPPLGIELIKSVINIHNWKTYKT